MGEWRLEEYKVVWENFIKCILRDENLFLESFVGF